VLKRNRTRRSQYGEIFVEGVACINALLAARWPIIAVAYDPARSLSSWAQQVIAQANPARILRLSTALMEKLSDRQDSSELLVIAERRVRRLDELVLDPGAVLLVFDRPSNTGNLGSIIRSCDAFGATALITTGHAVDIYDPIVLRASLGAFFTVPVIHCESPQTLEEWLEQARQQLPALRGEDAQRAQRAPALRVIGASAEAEKPISQADLTGPVVVILGNEATGISRKLAAMVDETLSIPMAGTVDSINVACAATVMLYEVARQRAAHA
jgi:23S rRNA (uridine2479-2'-O)-methyltransferase